MYNIYSNYDFKKEKQKCFILQEIFMGMPMMY